VLRNIGTAYLQRSKEIGERAAQGRALGQHALILHLMSTDSVKIDVLTGEGNDSVCFFKATEVIQKGILGLAGTAKPGVGLPACVNVDMHAHTKRCHFLSNCSTSCLTLGAWLTK
jgi:hypothetical protein